MKKIFLGADHAGFDLKEVLKTELLEKGEYEIIDLGTDNEETSVDYPAFGKKVGEAVIENKDSLGIVVCGTGIGISVAANKVKGIVAAPINSCKAAELFRQHNGGNVLALGGRDMEYIDMPNKIVETFLNNSLDTGERHERRRQQLQS